MDQTSKPGNGITSGVALRYAAVGGLNALYGFLQFAALWLLLHRWLNEYAILTISCLIVMALGYWMNRLFVFRSGNAWFAESKRYCLVFGISVAANYAVQFAMVTLFHVHPILAQLVATVVSSAIGFFTNTFYTFRRAG